MAFFAAAVGVVIIILAIQFYSYSVNHPKK